MLKYLLCFAPTVVGAIAIAVLGCLGRGDIDFFNLAPSRKEPLTDEEILSFVIFWTIVTGWIGIGLTICMGIYDIFSKWEKSREKKRIERIMAEDRAREALDTNSVPRL